MKIRSTTMPLFVVGAILMMVIPVPPMVLDLLLTVNIAVAVLIMLGVTFINDNMDMSVFPSLLLITTLVRLALNVSSTRLILLDGYAGKVIETFGNFVIGGSVVVGLVVFLILIIIQFVVITNGAGRVAEVGARFTLDAMPGKQMAIDADLAAGLIDQDQARAARKRIAKEADFYGAMDGASKFVKGDAIAGIIIVVINLFGGFAIGMGSKGMDLGEAVSSYSLLTVGDGLVSQIPALLISIATGLLVTRVGSDEALGSEVGRQLVHKKEAVRTTGAVIMGMALLPGLPKLPFIAIGLGLLLFSNRPQASTETAEQKAAAEVKVNPDDPESLMNEMRVEPLELHLSYDILDLIDADAGGDLLSRVKALRRQIAMELGVIIPLVRTRDDVSLAPGTYRILLHGVEVASGTAPRGHVLALPADRGTELAALGGLETAEPVFGLVAYWMPEALRQQSAALGATVVDRSSVIVTHLAEVARRNAGDLLTRQDVQQLVESLRYDEPLLANEVGTEHLPLSTLHTVLRGLLDEQVPVRDMSKIVEAVSAKALETRVPDHLLSAARASLGGTIVGRLASDGRLGVLTFDPAHEASLHEGLRDVEGEIRLVLDPIAAQQLHDQVNAAVQLALEGPVAIVCAAALRRPLQKLLAATGLEVPVIAYPELPSHIELETKGVIGLAHAQV
jgi:flagellar biosynthesis protein FlhA